MPACSVLMALTLTLQLAGGTPPPAPLDSASVVPLAHRMVSAVRTGDASTLWQAFDDEMRTAAGGDSAAYRGSLAALCTQLGTPDSCAAVELLPTATE